MAGIEDPDAGAVILFEQQFTYDAFGRRVGILTDSAGAAPLGPGVMKIVYNGNNAWSDTDESGAKTASYLFGDRTDQLIAQQHDGKGTIWPLARAPEQVWPMSV